MDAPALSYCPKPLLYLPPLVTWSQPCGDVGNKSTSEASCWRRTMWGVHIPVTTNSIVDYVLKTMENYLPPTHTHPPNFYLSGFPGGASGEEPTCQSRKGKRRGFDPRVGKILWRKKWQPTPVFLLKNPMDRGAWLSITHGVTKSHTWLSIHLSIHPSISVIRIIWDKDHLRHFCWIVC